MFFIIACDLSSADELLLTEMLFNGLFTNMDASQTAAVLSCFVCDERSNEMPNGIATKVNTAIDK